MIKSTLLIAAAFALSAQAAIAGPVGGSMTAGATTEKSGASSKASLLDSLLSQFKFSMSARRGTAGSSTGDATEYKSTPNKQCEQETSADEELEDGKVKKAQPAGPEPIYFGF